jgi:hypothetical protein
MLKSQDRSRRRKLQGHELCIHHGKGHGAGLGPDRRDDSSWPVPYVKGICSGICEPVETLDVGVPYCARMAQLTASIRFGSLPDCASPLLQMGPLRNTVQVKLFSQEMLDA